MSNHASISPTVSVVVPTYRRPDVLVTCLRALHRQSHVPCEVLVCRRESDEITAQCLQSLDESHRRLVNEVVVGPNDNLAKSLRAAIAASRGDLIALTDDDAEAPTDWLERLAACFSNPNIAAVGGKDILPGPSPAPRDTVGRVQWFGRLIGNHHAGIGPARGVDVLKGVNCCFRGDLLRSVGVDERLRGAGVTMHWEIAFCLPLRRSGHQIIYDPDITLAHHVAPRQGGDNNHRGGFNADTLADMVHNETFLFLEHLSPVGRVAFAAWGILVGTGLTPGMMQVPRLLFRGQDSRTVTRRCWATLRGRLLGAQTWVSRHDRSTGQDAVRIEPEGRE